MTLRDMLIVIITLSSISGFSLVLAVLSYAEARRVRELLAAVLTVGRAREIASIRRRASRRPRRRYIVFRVVSGGEVNERGLNLALLQAARRLVGTTVVADSGLQLVYYNPITMKGVLRVRGEYRNLAFGVLGMVRSVGDSRVILAPLTTAGTIKRARRLADSG